MFYLLPFCEEKDLQEHFEVIFNYLKPLMLMNALMSILAQRTSGLLKEN